MNPAAAANYEAARESRCVAALVERSLLIASQEVDKAVLGAQGAGATYVVEHPKIAFVSYPYEWSFSLLKAAALLHLDLHLAALEHGMTLSDASAYNVQFLGPRPLFVEDRKRVLDGKSGSVRLDTGGRLIIKKKTNNRI